MNISFLNKISPSGLSPNVPSSAKPFSIVVFGMIVLAKTIGLVFPNSTTSLTLIFLDLELIKVLSTFSTLATLSWISSNLNFFTDLILFVIGPFSSNQDLASSLTCNLILLKTSHDDICSSFIN